MFKPRWLCLNVNVHLNNVNMRMLWTNLMNNAWLARFPLMRGYVLCVNGGEEQLTHMLAYLECREQELEIFLWFRVRRYHETSVACRSGHSLIILWERNPPHRCNCRQRRRQQREVRRRYSYSTGQRPCKWFGNIQPRSPGAVNIPGSGQPGWGQRRSRVRTLRTEHWGRPHLISNPTFMVSIRFEPEDLISLKTVCHIE